MFCPKCGQKNDEDAKFCSYCGEEIIDTQPEEVTPGQFLRNWLDVFLRGDARKGGAAAKGFLKRRWKTMVICAAVVVIFIGGISAVRTLFSPERSARSFFESYMQGDWATVYREIYLPDGEMLDEAHFLQAAEEWETSEYLEYRMEPSSRTDPDSLYLDYRFTYSTPGSSEPSQMDVTLVRTGRVALFFDTYKVSLEGLVAENCTVTIPEGATLLLDGEALETETTVDGIRQICRLPRMFSGTYTIGLQHPVYQCEDITDYVGSGASFDLINNCSVNQTAMEDAAYGDVTEYLSALFEAALNGRSLEETEIPVFNDGETSASGNFRNFQEDCESYMSRRGTFQLTNVELDGYHLNTGDGTVNCTFSYECLRENVESTNQPTPFSGSAEMTVTFRDGTWQLMSFRIYNIY